MGCYVGRMTTAARHRLAPLLRRLRLGDRPTGSPEVEHATDGRVGFAPPARRPFQNGPSASTVEVSAATVAPFGIAANILLKLFV